MFIGSADVHANSTTRIGPDAIEHSRQRRSGPCSTPLVCQSVHIRCASIILWTPYSIVPTLVDKSFLPTVLHSLLSLWVHDFAPWCSENVHCGHGATYPTRRRKLCRRLPQICKLRLCTAPTILENFVSSQQTGIEKRTDFQCRALRRSK